MSSLTENLIKNIDKNHVNGEDYLNQGGWTKRQSDIMTGAREKEEFSRRQAAIALGISPKELKAIEKGVKVPSKALVIKMAGLYKVSLLGLWKYAA